MTSRAWFVGAATFVCAASATLVLAVNSPVNGVGTAATQGSTAKKGSGGAGPGDGPGGFQIEQVGPLPLLRPGSTDVPLRTQVFNPNNFDIVLHKVSARLRSADRPACAVDAISIQPFVSAAGVRVPRKGGVDVVLDVSWPFSPDVNDACQGATWSFNYDGEATRP